MGAYYRNPATAQENAGEKCVFTSVNDHVLPTAGPAKASSYEVILE